MPCCGFVQLGMVAEGRGVGEAQPSPCSCPRVVDGIEDNGRTSEPQTFCFNVDTPLQRTARDSPTLGTSRSARQGLGHWPWGSGSAPPPLEMSFPAGTNACSPALALEAEEIKQNIMRLNQEVRWGPEPRPRTHRGCSAGGSFHRRSRLSLPFQINHLNQEVSHLSRELQRMMELLQSRLGAPQPPACPYRLDRKSVV